MSLKNLVCGLLLAMIALAPSASAGKVELTTYYPAPYGEYTEVKASNKFKVPVTTAAAPKTTANTTAGELWVES